MSPVGRGHGIEHVAHGNVGPMFGPLNGVRIALVVAAALAAITSFVAGYTLAGLVLLAGVLLHGAGWLYLYGKRPAGDDRP